MLPWLGGHFEDARRELGFSESLLEREALSIPETMQAFKF